MSFGKKDYEKLCDLLHDECGVHKQRIDIEWQTLPARDNFQTIWNIYGESFAESFNQKEFGNIWIDEPSNLSSLNLMIHEPTGFLSQLAWNEEYSTIDDILDTKVINTLSKQFRIHRNILLRGKDNLNKQHIINI